MSAPVLDPDLLKAFVAVAHYRSFTRAAASLNRTQSAVSMQIKRLETRLDVPLLHRTTNLVRLSAAGENFLGYARRLLSLHDEAVRTLHGCRVAGLVRLGVMEDYGQSVISPLLARYAKRFPGVCVEMETGLTSAMVERLGATFDLVIAMHPSGHDKGELIRCERTLWATGQERDTERLDPLPLALYPAGCLFRTWAIQALDRAGRPWRLAFVSQNHAAVQSAAREGAAVTVVKAGSFPAGLRPLSALNGMPDLPVAEIRLHRAPDLSPAASHLAAHLRVEMEDPQTLEGA